MQNAQAISTHFRLTTSPCNHRNAYALCADALLQVGSFVRGGDWKCRAYYVLYLLRNTMQKYKNSSKLRRESIEKLCFSGFLESGATDLMPLV